jgi:3D (Asp-Asp-Asp) domain-containing protein
MDTGGAIKGKNRIDFAVFDKAFAKKIGRRKFEVYLISIGNGKVDTIKF